jgi:hypothetical protein
MYNDITLIHNIINEEEIQIMLNSVRLTSTEKKEYFAEPESDDGVRKTKKGDGIHFLVPIYTILKKLGIPHDFKYMKMVQMLHYPTGAFQHTHADNCIIEPRTGKVIKVKNWTHSAVVYLNDDFEGGEIVYPKKDFTFKPVAGSCVIHPAGSEHLHRVNPVTKGDRYCIVFRFILPEEDVIIDNAS